MKISSIWRQAAASLLIGVAAIIGAQSDQINNRSFDVFDEGAHFDYVVKLASGHIPAWGTKYEQATMLVADCLGNTLVASVTDCSIHDRLAENFPPAGFSYEAQQPPLGYLAYLPGFMLSNGLEPGPRLNFVRDAGGVVLIGLAMILVLLISRILSLGFWRTLLFGGLIMLAPIAIHALSTVNNDASALTTSLAFVYGLLLSHKMRARGSFILGAAVGILLGLTKAFMILLPASAVLVFGIVAIQRLKMKSSAIGKEYSRPHHVYALTASGASLIAAGIFSIWQTQRAVVPAGEVLKSLLGFEPTVDNVQLETVLSSWSNLANSWLGASNGLVSIPSFFSVINVLVLILAGVAFAYTKRPRPIMLALEPYSRAFISMWMVVILLFGLAWPALLFFQGGFNFDAPARYALQAMPLLAAGIVLRLGVVNNVEESKR